MPTAAKKAWISAEAAAGVREIEVGSFVPAKLLPQLADTAEMVAHALHDPRPVGGRAGAQLQGRGTRHGECGATRSRCRLSCQ
jgi:hypothetical protein